jgi:ABC-2 type transport system ATP-binding protein
MIRVEKIIKTYGAVRALDGLSLNVRPGVVYGFLGPNGAGKTTCMRILSGLARPDSGRVWIMGKEIGQRGTDIRRLIGVLPEEPVFYGWMTPREYLRDFVAPFYDLRGNKAVRRVDELLEIVGLKDSADRRLAGFSRGMRQRMGLAQAMVHQPPILLLDEPVSALDPAGRKEVLELIEHLRGHTTILLSTHILADVERVCDMVGIINRGNLVVQARRQDLLERYVTPLIEIETENSFGSWLEWVERQPYVTKVNLSNHTARISVTDVHLAQKLLLESLSGASLIIRRFEMVHPSLEDVFLKLTGKEA